MLKMLINLICWRGNIS